MSLPVELGSNEHSLSSAEFGDRNLARRTIAGKSNSSDNGNSSSSRNKSSETTKFPPVKAQIEKPIVKDTCPFERLNKEKLRDWKARLAKWWKEKLLSNLHEDETHFRDARKEYANIASITAFPKMGKAAASVKKHLLAYAPKLLEGDNKAKFANLYLDVIALSNTGSTSPEENKNKKKKGKSKRMPKQETQPIKQETEKSGNIHRDI